MKKLVFILMMMLILSFNNAFTQVAVSTDGSSADASAMLDIKSATRGLLIPRVALTGANDITTILLPATSLLVYNTATGGAGDLAVTPGFYYWSGTKWLTFSASSWLLSGNAGTSVATNFLGTIDNNSLMFKINNVKAGYIGVEANDGNVFLGYRSGLNNTGYSNVAVGIDALFTNTAKSNLVAIGDSALFRNTTGIQNTSLGSKALFANTSGEYNTATGYRSLYLNTTGSFNTASSVQSLYSNTSGNYNTANGFWSLFSNTTGGNNTASGYSALYSNTTGNYNTASGVSSLSNSTTGYNNTAFGYGALSSLTGGYSNTGIGYGANVSSGNLSNATAIGNGAIVNASSKIRFGNTAVSVIEGNVSYSHPSDARFKYEIQNNVPGLEFIEKLTPVTYYVDNEKLDKYIRTGVLDNSNFKSVSQAEKQLHTGFLAQDVEKIAKELGYSFDGVHAPANDKDNYSIAYSQFVMPLVKAVQQQQTQIEDLKKDNEELKSRLEKLEKLLIK